MLGAFLSSCLASAVVSHASITAFQPRFAAVWRSWKVCSHQVAAMPAAAKRVHSGWDYMGGEVLDELVTLADKDVGVG